MHIAPSTHSTHAPAPSHTVPPVMHIVFMGSGSCLPTPLSHASIVHSFMSSGTSLSSSPTMVAPAPSQTVCLQSPTAV